MSDRANDFTGSIPQFYDHGLGPVFFVDFADEIARRAAASAPMRLLELAAGTGIVTRSVAARGAFDRHRSQSANAGSGTRKISGGRGG